MAEHHVRGSLVHKEHQVVLAVEDHITQQIQVKIYHMEEVHLVKGLMVEKLQVAIHQAAEVVEQVEQVATVEHKALVVAAPVLVILF